MTFDVSLQVPVNVNLPGEGAFRFGGDTVRAKVSYTGAAQVQLQSRDLRTGSPLDGTLAFGGTLGLQQSAQPFAAAPRPGSGGGGAGVAQPEVTQGVVVVGLREAWQNATVTAGGSLDLVELCSQAQALDVGGVTGKLLELLSVSLGTTVVRMGRYSGDVAVGIGLDADGCLFSAAVQVTVSHEIRLRGQVLPAQTTRTVTLKFGPGLRVYLALARRAGLPAVEGFLRQVLPAAETGAVSTLMRSLGVWTFAAQAGYDIMRLSQFICRTEWERGAREGTANRYASAFVRAAFLGPQTYLEAFRNQDAVTQRAVRDLERMAHHCGFLQIQQTLCEEFNGGTRFPVHPATGFATTTNGLERMIQRLGDRLASGAPGLDSRY